MPVTFRILRDRNLVYIRYAGLTRVDETVRAMAACITHPDFDPRARHIVDMRAVTAFEADYPAFLAMQASATDIYHRPDHVPFFVYIAPGPVAQSMARLVIRQWQGIPDVVLRLVAAEDEALALLGIAGVTLADLLAPAR